ncbi:MAG: hypothetical protein RBS39_09085 [Phycisphaerales bacterium]|jgi:hypothetical protein|nr:hypothetical protein [Phycisphaerales bacterium]
MLAIPTHDRSKLVAWIQIAIGIAIQIAVLTTAPADAARWYALYFPLTIAIGAATLWAGSLLGLRFEDAPGVVLLKLCAVYCVAYALELALMALVPFDGLWLVERLLVFGGFVALCVRMLGMDAVEAVLFALVSWLMKFALLATFGGFIWGWMDLSGDLGFGIK